jgi:hypothetical protein
MVPRIGAWLIDSLILFAVTTGFWQLAVMVGALTVNPEAQRQLDASPLSMPTVAPYGADLPLLGAMLAVYVVLNVVYATICWTRFRAMPGQKLFSLQVGVATTGRNLSPGRAFVRAAVVLGVPAAGAAGAMVGGLAYLSSVPWSEVANPQPGGQAEAWLNVWGAPLYAAVLLAFMWPVLLLIVTASSPIRQGLHDRLAGSLVVGKVGRTQAGAALASGRWPGVGSPGGGQPPGHWAPPGLGSPPNAWPPGTVPPGFLQPGNEPPPGEWPVGQVPPEATSADAKPPEADYTQAWLGSDGEAKTTPTTHPATVGRRIGAYMFDCGFVVVVYLMIESVVSTILNAEPGTFDERTLILIGLLGGLWQLVYFTAGWALWRGTLGQRAMSLRVTDATSRKALPWIDAVVRWAILQGPFALSTIVPLIARGPIEMAASIWVMFLLYTTTNDPNLRGLHDRFLNSRVDLEL